MAEGDAPQAGLGTRTDAQEGVLSGRLAKLRALPEGERPADATGWLCSEELQDDFRTVLASWREWPADGRCDESAKALALLFAAADAAPAEMEVFFPTEDRHLWQTRLLGPAILRAEGRKHRWNSELHKQIWGCQWLRGTPEPGFTPGRISPDDLLKFVGAGYLGTFGCLGSEAAQYQELTQCYVLLGRCGVTLREPRVEADMRARLAQLGSPLTFEGLHHFVLHQKIIAARSMLRHREERQHFQLQMATMNAVLLGMLPARPRSPRTHAIASRILLEMGICPPALSVAQQGLALEGTQAEPYHRALMHMTAARALAVGAGAGAPIVNVAALQEELAGARAAKAACKAWLPSMLSRHLKEDSLRVGFTPQQLKVAQEAGQAVLPAVPLPPPPGILAAQAGVASSDEHLNAGEVTLESLYAERHAPTDDDACHNCPLCRAKRGCCSACGNVVVVLKKCSACRVVAYCSRECQRADWRAGHREQCAQLAARYPGGAGA